jgi:hypothetical protein
MNGLGDGLVGSISEDIARTSHLPALFLGPHARPFVDRATGAMHLQRMTVAVAEDLAPRRAIETLRRLFGGSFKAAISSTSVPTRRSSSILPERRSTSKSSRDRCSTPSWRLQSAIGRTYSSWRLRVTTGSSMPCAEVRAATCPRQMSP